MPMSTTQSRLKIRVTRTVEFYDTTSLNDLDVRTVAETGDPAIDIPRRVEQLAELLGCSEEIAERLLLNHQAL